MYEGFNERIFTRNDPQKNFAQVWKKYPRVVEAPEVKHRQRGAVGDIAYLKNKVGLTLPTVRQVLASYNLTLNKKSSIMPNYTYKPTPTVRSTITSEKTSNHELMDPTMSQDMAPWMEQSTKRRLTAALLSKIQIMAEMRRNTLLMERITTFRRNSQTKKAKRATDLRNRFNQDGAMLIEVKQELAQDKRKKLVAMHKRRETYRKLYLGAKNEPRGTSSVTTNASSIDM